MVEAVSGRQSDLTFEYLLGSAWCCCVPALELGICVMISTCNLRRMILHRGIGLWRNEEVSSHHEAVYSELETQASLATQEAAQQTFATTVDGTRTSNKVCFLVWVSCGRCTSKAI